ncbi:DUF2147 domain-containing protein [Gluconobacter wancherniae]|nr:DUF2147 domain-containing protein [Gluconobacter wancherniae]
MRARSLLPGLFLIFVGLFMHAPVWSETPMQASAVNPEEGLWLTEDKDGIFLIQPCGNMLCGQLVGMSYDGAVPVDVWGRSQCRLQMLTDFTPAEDQKWHGHILDPRSGRVYQARIWSPEPEVLKLRGFVLGMPLFGETQTWRRYHGAPIGANCKMPPSL